ncbi:hypothetical protein MMC25_000872 [Agyrium rufum]|nr:hypothetical protein [Agyrium rufum]
MASEPSSEAPQDPESETGQPPWGSNEHIEKVAAYRSLSETERLQLRMPPPQRFLTWAEREAELAKKVEQFWVDFNHRGIFLPSEYDRQMISPPPSLSVIPRCGVPFIMQRGSTLASGIDLTNEDDDGNIELFDGCDGVPDCKVHGNMRRPTVRSRIEPFECCCENPGSYNALSLLDFTRVRRKKEKKKQATHLIEKEVQKKSATAPDVGPSRTR